MNVPTEDDWRSSEPRGLDEECAYENFHGKTVGEAVRLFEENSIRYQEDLMYMPRRVFGYYLPACIVGLDEASTKRDFLRVLGPPDAASVDSPLTARHDIPDWIRYDRPDHSFNVSFEGDAISSVFLAGPGPFIPPRVSGAPTTDDLKRVALAVWESYVATLPSDITSERRPGPSDEGPEGPGDVR